VLLTLLKKIKMENL